jgi:hypothetical protein
MRFLDGRAHDRQELLGGLARLDHIPDFDEVGPARQLRADQRPRLLGAGRGNDRRIGRVAQHRRTPGRNERSRDGDSRRPLAGDRAVTHIEIPHRTAHVGDPGHAAGQIAREHIVDAGAHPRRLRLVGNYRAQIEPVGPSVEPARLEEMDVRVDVARHDPAPGRIDDLDPGRDAHPAAPADLSDATAAHHHDRVGDGRAAVRVDDSAAPQHQVLRLRGRRRQAEEDEKKPPDHRRPGPPYAATRPTITGRHARRKGVLPLQPIACPVLPQSSRKALMPLSVSGCLKSWRITEGGAVITSAPIFAASSTWMGLRTLATRIWVVKA